MTFRHLPDPGPVASPPRSWLLVWDGGPDARHPYPFMTFESADRYAAQLDPETHPNLRAVPWGVATDRPVRRRRPTGSLVALLDDLIRDNNLTCDPHPDNKRCMCSTARALRVLAGEEEW